MLKRPILVGTQTIAVGALVVANLSTATTAVALPGGCDNAAISNALGQPVSVVRCEGDWAYVSNGSEGDSTSLVHLVNGSWLRYTGFPSSICKGAAAADGVPTAELSSFPGC